MALPPIASIPGLSVANATPAVPSIGTSGPPAEGAGFGTAVVAALEELAATQDRADGLAVQAANGTLTDIHDFTIAASEASLATELTVAVRNRAVEAFNQIMQMQV